MSGVLKLIYLLAGLSLKETIDSLRAIWKSELEHLEQQKAILKEYKPNPAVLAGSQEAYETIARAQWAADAAPHIKEMNRKIARLKLLPVIAWGLSTVILVVLIIWIEMQSPEPDQQR